MAGYHNGHRDIVLHDTTLLSNVHTCNGFVAHVSCAVPNPQYINYDVCQSLLVKVIQNLTHQSTHKYLTMSLSVESLGFRRKRTATERAENNGDPLVVKKKAREAANNAQAPAVKKGPSVSLYIL